jgi:hypothetical protein
LLLFVIIVIWKEQMDSISDGDDDDVDSPEKADIVEVRLGKHGH